MAVNETLQFVLEAVDKTKDAFKSVQGGLTSMGKKLEDAKPQFQKLAAVGVAGMVAIGAEIGVAVNAFAESQKQLAVADEIVTTFSKKTIKEMGGSVETATDQVYKFGAQLQALGGISDEEASIGVAKLTQITGNFAEAQRAAGLAADLSKFKNIDYTSAVSIMGKVLNGNTAILGKYGIEIDKNATKEQALAAMTKAFGGQYEAFGKTVAGQMEILNQSFGDIQENIGKAFLPILQQVLDKIKPIIDAIVQWTAEHPKLVAGLLAAGFAVSAFTAAVGLLALAVIAYTAAATPAAVATWALVLPWIAIVAAITFAVASVAFLAYEIHKHWDGLVWMAEEASENIKNFVTEKWEILKDNLQMIWESIKTTASNVWEEIKQFFIAYWPILLSVFLGPLGVIIAAVIKNWDTIKNTTEAVWGGITAYFKGFWNGLKEIFGAAVDWIMEKIQKLLDAWDRVKSAASSVGSAIGSAGKAVGNAASSAYGGVKDFFTGRASGGSMNPNQPYIVGEHGPELFTPNSYGRMTPSVAGGGITINFSGNSFIGREDIAEQIGNDIIDVLKRTVKI